uniref:7TM_GPCR_Srx domain-containing protein n=1 Tax=Heterorhabditis bacteriophora TaxID=37862 RepID=A0A1I7WB31_HETBA
MLILYSFSNKIIENNFFFLTNLEDNNEIQCKSNILCSKLNFSFHLFPNLVRNLAEFLNLIKLVFQFHLSLMHTLFRFTSLCIETGIVIVSLFYISIFIIYATGPYHIITNNHTILHFSYSESGNIVIHYITRLVLMPLECKPSKKK